MILGPELVKNGDFSSTSDWVVNDPPWEIIFNTLSVPIAIAQVGDTTQSIDISNGTKYLVSWLDVSFGTADYTVTLGNVDVGTPVVGVVNEFEVIAGTGTDIVFSYLSSGNPIAIDNVSVKAVSVATNIEEAIFDLMRSTSTINSLIESRVYPEVVPQNTALPAVYYTQIAGPRQHTLGSTDDMVPSRWQFTIVGTSYAELRTISDAIRLILDSFSGTVGDVVVQCSHLIDENDLTDIRPGTDKLRRYTKAMDFNIWYNE